MTTNEAGGVPRRINVWYEVTSGLGVTVLVPGCFGI